MKKIYLLGIVGSLCFSSCEKDDATSGGSTTTTTTVTQDKANINIALDEIVACLSNVKNGAFLNSIVAFSGLSDGEALKEEFVESVLNANLGTVLDVDNSADGKFDFNKFVGTYTYNSVDSTWSKSTAQTTKMIFHFPSADTATSNNAEVSINSYTDIQAIMDGETVYLPTKANATVKVDGSLIAEFNIVDVTYDVGLEVSIPTNIEASLFLAPFTYTAKATRNTTTDFSASIAMADGVGCDYIMDANLTLDHDDYENLEDEDFLDLSGKVKHNDLQVNYSIDLASLGALPNEPTIAQVNNEVTAEVLFDSQKIGDLILEEDVNEELDVIIQYKDGTSENTDVYFDTFADNVEALVTDLTGDW